LPTLAYPKLAEIQERPELPALTMLHNALGTAREAILRAHPDTRFLYVFDAPTCHEDGDFCWAAHMLAINEIRFPQGFDPGPPSD